MIKPNYFFMKKPLSLIAALAISSIAITGCGGGPNKKDISNAMVDSVVLPSYSKLVQASKDLNQDIKNLISKPSKISFEKARRTWRSSRKAWEKTETWAYGPAETLDFDPNLDDWPVSTNELSQTLDSKSAFTINTFKKLDTTSRGFHGIEYVLFGRGNNSVEDLNPNELAYLKIAGDDLVNNSEGLLLSWSGVEGFGTMVVKSNPSNAILDILSGIEGCMAEVSDGKLGAAFDTNDSGALESTFSGNTGNDIVSNLKGVKAAWEKSKLRAYTSSENKSLSITLSKQIDDSIRLADKLPARLNDQLKNDSTKDIVNKLRNVLNSAVETTIALSSEIS